MTDKITKSESKAVISLSTGVFLVFLFLKLAEMGQVASWSWWWVTSPLWIPLVIVMAILILVVIAAIILGAISTAMGANSNRRLRKLLNKRK